ncbi:MAG: GNAT family N-acetyltransferase [Anaerolineales bacterium]|nr:GNAT family N-acetyltransferase [Anaerolineales bacterium]
MATIAKTLASSTAPHLRSFDIRRDLGAVADLVELCFTDTLDADGRSYLSRMRAAANKSSLLGWASHASEWASVPMKGYVWEQDGRLVGNASVIPYFLKGTRFYLVANVAVHPEYRRRGIARALTERAIEHARRRGSPSVWLQVREENDPAVTLYRALGFVEMARRTTWYCDKDFPPAEDMLGLTFQPPQSRDWPWQKTWLRSGYPPELSWHMSFNRDVLRPGIVGAFFRFIYDAYIKQWAVYYHDQIRAALTWQSSLANANTLWLAAPADIDDLTLYALLIYARRHLPSPRPVMLEYPAGQSSTAIQQAGFYNQQTLIWMRLIIEK